MEETLNNNDIENYISFVQKSIAKVKSHSDIICKPDISLADLREITSKRLEVFWALRSERTRYDMILKSMKTDYKVWWSEKYSTSRHRLNPKELAGNKYASKAEIEAETIKDNKETYISWQRKLLEMEGKFDFINDLIQDWKTVQMDITNLISLEKIEANELGFSNRANSQASDIPRRTKK